MTNQKQTSNLTDWDELEGNTEPLTIPDPTVEVEETEVVVAVKEELVLTTPSPTDTITLSHEHELIAQAMVMTRGDVAKASRLDSVDHNAMSLRREVKNHPEIRRRYQELLSDELMDRGLHVSERILRMVDLQDKAMGCTVMVEGPDGMEEMDMPADPKMVIELSKEISRLIAEGKNQNMSTKAAVMLTSKEDAKEILAAFLES